MILWSINIINRNYCRFVGIFIVDELMFIPIFRYDSLEAGISIVGDKVA